MTSDQRPSAIKNIEAQLAAHYQAEPLTALHANYAFQTLEKLGEGGMGQVYKVLDKRLGRLAALKILAPTIFDKPEAKARFLREAEITAQLDHPAIPPVYEAGVTADQQLYLLLRLIRGQTLTDTLEQYQREDRLHDRRNELLQVVLRVAEAIAYAHEQGIIHRDLKPDNVMVGEHGEVLVLDWGVAKIVSSSEGDQDLKTPLTEQQLAQLDNAGLTVEGGLIGTPGYMSPEQFDGQAVDERGDIFALGLILCEVLTGRPALKADTALELFSKTVSGDITLPRSLDGSIPRDLNWIAEGALETDPELRTASAREFVSQLRDALADRPVDGYSYSVLESTLRGVRRHPAALMMLTLVVVLGTSMLSLWLNLERERARSQAISLQSQLTLAQETSKREAAERKADMAEGVLSAFNEARDLARRGAPKEALIRKLEEALERGQRASHPLRSAAEILQQAGYDRDAEALLDEAVARHPPAYWALFAKHELELKAKGVSFEVTAAFRKILAEAKARGDRNEFVELALGLERMAANDNQGALKHFMAIEQHSTTFMPGALSLGLVQLKLGQLEDALRQAERVLELDPENPRGYSLRAAVRSKQGQTQAALKDYKTAIDMSKDNPQLRFASLLSRGLLHNDLGQKEQAREDFKAASRLSPKNTTALYNLALMSYDLKKYQSAVLEFSKVLALEPENFRAFICRSNCHRQLGHYKRALKDMEKALTIGKGDSQTRNIHGLILYKLGRFGDAASSYEQSLELDPKNWEALRNRGDLNRALNKTKQALKDYSLAIKLKPNATELYIRRGDLLRQLRQWRESLADFNKALELDPKSVAALNNRGLLYNEMKHPEDAFKDYNEAIKLSPESYDTYYNRAVLSLRYMRIRPAIKDLNVVIKNQPKDMSARFARAIAYSRLRDKASAKKDLEFILKVAPDHKVAASARKMLKKLNSQ